MTPEEKRLKLEEAVIEATQLVHDMSVLHYKKYFYEFNESVLGWPDIYEPLHIKVCDFVQANIKKKKLLILLPRGCFKSSIITIGYPLWRIAQDPSSRGLIANATYPMAVGFLRQIKNNLETNQKFKELYGDMATGATTWKEDEIKVVHPKSHLAKEATVTAIGLKSNYTGKHFDYAILDDMVNRDNIGTRERIQEVVNFYKDTLDLVDVNEDGHKEVIIIGCFSGGTKVLMGNGEWKDIEKISPGEVVKTRFKDRTVKAMIPQGESDVYRLRTPNSIIEATDNHPFLLDGEWVELKDLKVGDKISFYRKKVGGGNMVSQDMAWAFGYIVGDGWVTLHPNKKGSMRYVIGIAEGVYEDRNEKIVKILEDNFGCKFRSRNRNFRANSAKLGRFLLDNGLKRGAKKKDVPNWVFEQSLEVRLAFIKGFLAADGWEEKKRHARWGDRAGTEVRTFSYEVTSKELAEGVRRLALISGVRVSNIYSRERFIQAPNSKEPVLSKTFHCRLKFDKDLKELDGLSETRVVSIDYVGKKPVYDLSVEGEHSFIAEGFVVHNTTWHQDDLYARIQDPGEGLIDDFAVLRLPAYSGEWEEGELLFPGRLGWKQMADLKRQQGSSHFAAQYLLDPVPLEDALFKFDFKYYEPTDIEGIKLNKFITIDPALTEKKEADFSTMVCVGVDKKNSWYVLDIWRDKVNPKRLLDQIFYWDQKHKPVQVGVETTAFQRILQFFAYEEMKKRNKFIPLKELKHSDRAKEDRIRGLEPRYETGTIYHNRYLKNNQFLEDELRRFPKGKNDDVIDALASMLEIAHPPRVKTKRKYSSKGGYSPKSLY